MDADNSRLPDSPAQAVTSTRPVVQVHARNAALDITWQPIEGAASYRVRVGEDSSVQTDTGCLVSVPNGRQIPVSVTALDPHGRRGEESEVIYAMARALQPLNMAELEELHSGRREWLIDDVLIRGTSMVLAAEAKAGKSLALLDLAVALSSGQQTATWMGTFAVTGPSSVLAFWGEDSPEETRRRVHAICESKGMDPGDLDLRMCFQLPNLSRADSLSQIDALLTERPASVVILDPLYLAIGEQGNGADLYAMGGVLAGFGDLCRRHGATAIVAHHWNKTGLGKGSSRASGTGTVQWARTNISMAVDHLPDDEHGRSTAVLELDISGNSVQPQRRRVRRRMWVTDPSDSLNCALEYRVNPQDGPPAPVGIHTAICTFLDARGDWVTFTAIREATGGRTDTVRDALQKLVDSGRIEQTSTARGTRTSYRLPVAHADTPTTVGSDAKPGAGKGQLPF